MPVEANTAQFTQPTRPQWSPQENWDNAFEWASTLAHMSRQDVMALRNNTGIQIPNGIIMAWGNSSPEENLTRLMNFNANQTSGAGQFGGNNIADLIVAGSLLTVGGLAAAGHIPGAGPAVGGSTTTTAATPGTTAPATGGTAPATGATGPATGGTAGSAAGAGAGPGALPGADSVPTTFPQPGPNGTVVGGGAPTPGPGGSIIPGGVPQLPVGAEGGGNFFDSLFGEGGSLSREAFEEFGSGLLTPENLAGLGLSIFGNSDQFQDPNDAAGRINAARGSFDANTQGLNEFGQLATETGIGELTNNLPTQEEIFGLLNQQAQPGEDRLTNKTFNTLSQRGRLGVNDSATSTSLEGLATGLSNAEIGRQLTSFNLFDSLRTGAVDRAATLHGIPLNTAVASSNVDLGVGSGLLRQNEQRTNPLDLLGSGIR